jgi:5-methylcytosine-specific restriction endonuclease McrA
MSDVLRALNLKVTGGNFSSVKGHFQRLGISMEYLRIKKPTHSVADKEWEAVHLVEHHKVAGSRLLARLLSLGLFDRRCSNCGITKWNDQPAPLEVDHINGVHDDNRIENLRILCVNCRITTDTWGNKKRA